MGKIEDVERYKRAAHAVQTGVAAEIQLQLNNAASPKHLRTGVNTAKVEQGALAKLLISKGVFTEDEYFSELADAMERERDAYELRLSQATGKTVRLS